MRAEYDLHGGERGRFFAEYRESANGAGLLTESVDKAKGASKKRSSSKPARRRG
jgi:hypothetical protein